MISVLKLSAMAVLPVIASIILYLLEKKTSFGKMNSNLKQALFGVIFGGIAVLGTEFGVDVGGAIINVRDASVLSAGLIFGAPAGIIAGLLGGIERFFAVYWGAGTYTQIACTVSTILAGFIGAALRKHMFDNKKPSWPYALGIGIVTEVLHMLMIFVTNMSDIKTAFTFVEKCSIPMIASNGLSLMASVLIVSLIGKERIRIKNYDKQISVQFQRGLLICIAIAILITGTFTLFLQNSISETETNRLLTLNIADVREDISDASDSNLLRVTKEVAAKLNKQTKITNEFLNDCLTEFNVAEINVINSDGIIEKSTYHDFIGYDMSSGEQSKEFLVLLNGEKQYVQSYQPTSYNKEVSRKYAGVVLDNGKFIQVGYDAEQFQSDLSNNIKGITKNRHIGSGGCILIVDENMNIVSTRDDLNKDVIENDKLPSDVNEKSRFTMKVYGEESYCMYEKNEGYCIIAVLPVTEAVFSRNVSVYVMLFMEILIFVCLFILIYYLIKQLVVNNIRKVNESLSKITDGNLDVTVDVRSNEEFASLSDDINSTVVTLKKYIDEAAARIDKELEFAKSIQHSALPSVFPPYPNRSDFSIFATMDAAKEVGGDFYDFYFTGNDEFAFLVADVSGKGIPAAMFMMRAKTLIKSYAEAGMSVEKILTLANEKLCEGNDAEMFVTAWIGKINLKTGEFSFANAGHNPPLVCRDGNYEYLKCRAGFVLGGMDGIVYKKNEIQLSPGDKLFLYTDGVTEATNVNEELFGDARLQESLNKTVADEPDGICRSVKNDIDSFVGEAPQFDDITMLSFYWKGANDNDDE